MPSAHAVELVLATVPGVAHAAVESSDAGQGALKIRVAEGHDPVEVARQVSATLQYRFGIELAPETLLPASLRASGNGSESNGQGGAPSVVDAETPSETRSAEPVGPVAELSPDSAGEAATELGGNGLLPAQHAETDQLELPADVGAVSRPVHPSTDRHDGVVGIHAVAVVERGISVRARVELEVAGRTEAAEADGAATRRMRLLTPGLATLRAAEAATGDRFRAALEHVGVEGHGQDQWVVAIVTVVTASMTQRLLGASFVGEDEGRAVADAVADALGKGEQLL